MKAGNFDAARQSLNEYNDKEKASEQDINEKRQEYEDFERRGDQLRQMVSGKYQ